MDKISEVGGVMAIDVDIVTFLCFLQYRSNFDTYVELIIDNLRNIVSLRVSHKSWHRF